MEQHKTSIVKRFLFKVLKQQHYLKLLHICFRLLYSLNLLKWSSSYKYHYFNRQLIKKGFYILDIGANLGYHTTLFSKWAGNTGKVFAIEPVALFYDTLTWAVGKNGNVTCFNYALGEEEKEVTLATPGNYGYLRTGLPHVINQSEKDNYEFSFNARMKRASILFANLPKLDFIKCDIEGYEEIVLPEMKELLVKFKPMIQLETWGGHRLKVEPFLLSLGYEAFDIVNNKLVSLSHKTIPSSDILYIYKQETAQNKLRRA